MNSELKIAILTSGILPVPAVQGGAVENLIDFYLQYNDRHRLHDITVYSVWHPDVENHPARQSAVNHYYYIKVEGWGAKIRKHLLHLLHRRSEYYHYTIEYFLHQALKDIRRRHYDLIILENRPGYALHLSHYSLPSRIVMHLHNDLLNDQTPHFQTLYDRATRIITVSDYIKRRVQTINAADTKTLTVYNGIDVEAFASADRAALGLRADDFVLVYSGRMTKDKGILQLVEAMHLLKDDERIRLLVIGSAFYANAQGDDAFVASLKEKAQGLAGRIVFTGFVPYAQMPAYLKAADIAVLPSVWQEPLGLTCIEAMACGLPVVTTCQGGIPETVTPDCGILLPADEQLPQHIAAAVRDLRHDPQRRALMAQAAAQRARRFDKETYARQFFEALS